MYYLLHVKAHILYFYKKEPKNKRAKKEALLVKEEQASAGSSGPAEVIVESGPVQYDQGQ